MGMDQVYAYIYEHGVKHSMKRVLNELHNQNDCSSFLTKVSEPFLLVANTQSIVRNSSLDTDTIKLLLDTVELVKQHFELEIAEEFSTKKFLNLIHYIKALLVTSIICDEEIGVTEKVEELNKYFPADDEALELPDISPFDQNRFNYKRVQFRCYCLFFLASNKETEEFLTADQQTRLNRKVFQPVTFMIETVQEALPKTFIEEVCRQPAAARREMVYVNPAVQEIMLEMFGTLCRPTEEDILVIVNHMSRYILFDPSDILTSQEIMDTMYDSDTPGDSWNSPRRNYMGSGNSFLKSANASGQQYNGKVYTIKRTKKKTNYNQGNCLLARATPKDVGSPCKRLSPPIMEGWWKDVNYLSKVRYRRSNGLPKVSADAKVVLNYTNVQPGQRVKLSPKTRSPIRNLSVTTSESAASRIKRQVSRARQSSNKVVSRTSAGANKKGLICRPRTKPSLKINLELSRKQKPVGETGADNVVKSGAYKFTGLNGTFWNLSPQKKRRRKMLAHSRSCRHSSCKKVLRNAVRRPLSLKLKTAQNLHPSPKSGTEKLLLSQSSSAVKSPKSGTVKSPEKLLLSHSSSAVKSPKSGTVKSPEKALLSRSSSVVKSPKSDDVKSPEKVLLSHSSSAVKSPKSGDVKSPEKLLLSHSSSAVKSPKSGDVKSPEKVLQSHSSSAVKSASSPKRLVATSKTSAEPSISCSRILFPNIYGTSSAERSPSGAHKLPASPSSTPCAVKSAKNLPSNVVKCASNTDMSLRSYHAVAVKSPASSELSLSSHNLSRSYSPESAQKVLPSQKLNTMESSSCTRNFLLSRKSQCAAEDTTLKKRTGCSSALANQEATKGLAKRRCAAEVELLSGSSCSSAKRRRITMDSLQTVKDSDKNLKVEKRRSTFDSFNKSSVTRVESPKEKDTSASLNDSKVACNPFVSEIKESNLEISEPEAKGTDGDTSKALGVETDYKDRTNCVEHELVSSMNLPKDPLKHPPRSCVKTIFQNEEPDLDLTANDEVVTDNSDDTSEETPNLKTTRSTKLKCSESVSSSLKNLCSGVETESKTNTLKNKTAGGPESVNTNKAGPNIKTSDICLPQVGSPSRVPSDKKRRFIRTGGRVKSLIAQSSSSDSADFYINLKTSYRKTYRKVCKKQQNPISPISDIPEDLDRSTDFSDFSDSELKPIGNILLGATKKVKSRTSESEDAYFIPHGRKSSVLSNVCNIWTRSSNDVLITPERSEKPDNNRSEEKDLSSEATIIVNLEPDKSLEKNSFASSFKKAPAKAGTLSHLQILRQAPQSNRIQTRNQNHSAFKRKNYLRSSKQPEQAQRYVEVGDWLIDSKFKRYHSSSKDLRSGNGKHRSTRSLPNQHHDGAISAATKSSSPSIPNIGRFLKAPFIKPCILKLKRMESIDTKQKSSVRKGTK